jgi:hypothetical protein
MSFLLSIVLALGTVIVLRDLGENHPLVKSKEFFLSFLNLFFGVIFLSYVFICPPKLEEALFTSFWVWLARPGLITCGLLTIWKTLRMFWPKLSPGSLLSLGGIAAVAYAITIWMYFGYC